MQLTSQLFGKARGSSVHLALYSDRRYCLFGTLPTFAAILMAPYPPTVPGTGLGMKKVAGIGSLRALDLLGSGYISEISGKLSARVDFGADSSNPACTSGAGLWHLSQVRQEAQHRRVCVWVPWSSRDRWGLLGAQRGTASQGGGGHVALLGGGQRARRLGE